MYAELKLELENEELSYRQSSNLQGVIMETIDSNYAKELHYNQENPYSQCLLHKDDKHTWKICTMTDEAYEKIILPMSKLSEFSLKKDSMKVQITKRQLQTIDEKELLEEFYNKEGKRYFNLAFQTPTAFKQNGRYVFYPDLRLIYQSLMMKYSATSDEMDMIDEDTLEQLTQNSEIVRYRLQSQNFPLEGVNVQGFWGNIRIRIRGTDTMARYARLLMRFGNYSGVGIKTAMGMGAIKLEK